MGRRPPSPSRWSKLLQFRSIDDEINQQEDATEFFDKNKIQGGQHQSQVKFSRRPVTTRSCELCYAAAPRFCARWRRERAALGGGAGGMSPPAFKNDGINN